MKRTSLLPIGLAAALTLGLTAPTAAAASTFEPPATVATSYTQMRDLSQATSGAYRVITWTDSTQLVYSETGIRAAVLDAESNTVLSTRDVVTAGDVTSDGHTLLGFSNPLLVEHPASSDLLLFMAGFFRSQTGHVMPEYFGRRIAVSINGELSLGPIQRVSRLDDDSSPYDRPVTGSWRERMAVGYNPDLDQFLAVYKFRLSSQRKPYEMFGQLLDADLNAIGEPVKIYGPVNDARTNADVEYLPATGKWAVVMTTPVDINSKDIAGKILNADLSAVDPATITVAARATPSPFYARPITEAPTILLRNNGREFLVAYIDGFRTRVAGRWFDGNFAQPMGEDFTFAEADEPSFKGLEASIDPVTDTAAVSVMNAPEKMGQHYLVDLASGPNGVSFLAETIHELALSTGSKLSVGKTGRIDAASISGNEKEILISKRESTSTADQDLTLSDSTVTVAAGDEFTTGMTLSVLNATGDLPSLSVARDAELYVSVPADLAIISATGCDWVAAEHTCHIKGPLEVGRMDAVEFRFSTASMSGITVSETRAISYTLTSTTPDDNLANNGAYSPVTVNPVGGLVAPGNAQLSDKAQEKLGGVCTRLKESGKGGNSKVCM